MGYGANKVMQALCSSVGGESSGWEDGEGAQSMILFTSASWLSKGGSSLANAGGYLL